MWWLFCHLRFVLFASTMEFVTTNDQCRTEVNIQGVALRRSVFKRWSLPAPHLCDVKCGQEITCQSYNYNRKNQICELNNRTKEARPDNFLSAPAWIYIRRLNGRAPLGSIPELPALSCHEIKASEGKHTISGKYWLDPTGKGNAKLIYCDMVNEDMDECKFNISDCDLNANCTNTFGSYKCTCKVGYIGDGHSCSDIDECKGNNSCHVNATCTNTKGSYVCTCHPGYTGNGRDCTDIEECKGNHFCHVNATCMNTKGSYVCTCHPGYTGNGRDCTDIDECKGKHSCHVNATCTNTLGSHVCQCHAGYTGNGQNCAVRWIQMTPSTVCFGARDDSYGFFRNAKAGNIITFKLTYKSGYVTCHSSNSSYQSKWGCLWNRLIPNQMATLITDKNRNLLLPKSNFLSDYRDCKFYSLPWATTESPQLLFDNFSTPLTVETNQEFQIWYSEDLFKWGYEDNGYEKTCVAVYGLYV